MSILTIVLAHPGHHVHPHGIDVATVLVVGGIAILLGLAVRALRQER